MIEIRVLTPTTGRPGATCGWQPSPRHRRRSAPGSPTGRATATASSAGVTG
ncbi:hypothetical protein NKG94_24025 [Micromonospora sp. M12]